MDHRVFRMLAIAAGIFLAMAGGKVFARRSGTLRAEPQTQTSAGTRVPVLVELFTSEGCSSCPPADQMLARFVEKQPVAGVEIVALEEHVDYWNRLGWVDPFSSEGFSLRQTQYSEAFGSDTVYTPQMVIDGRTEFVGNNERLALEAIALAARSRKAEVLIARGKDSGSKDTLPLEVHVEGIAGQEAADIFLAITEDGLSTAVPRGENAGRELGHSSVMRVVHALGEAKPGAANFSAKATLNLPAEWHRENLRVVAFVQEKKSRRVLGAGGVTLAKLLSSAATKQTP